MAPASQDAGMKKENMKLQHHLMDSISETKLLQMFSPHLMRMPVIPSTVKRFWQSGKIMEMKGPIAISRRSSNDSALMGRRDSPSMSSLLLPITFTYQPLLWHQMTH